MSEIEQLREELATTRAELDAYRERYQKALERARLLELGILAGRKSERLHGDDEAQMSMQLLALLKGAEEDGVSVVVVEDGPHDADDDAPGDAEGQLEGARARGRGRARRALPEALPRVEIEVTPPEVQEEGLAAFRRIGEEVSEVVERRPASLVVVRIVRPKYARKDEGPETIAEQLAEETPTTPAVVIAAPPERPIERGLAGPGLLAQTLTMRWQDHLPLHRQEAIFARDGLPLARQTICDWHLQLAELCAPLVDAMMVDAFTAPYVCVDATGVLVQAEERCRRAHFWVLVAPPAGQSPRPATRRVSPPRRARRRRAARSLRRASPRDPRRHRHGRTTESGHPAPDRRSPAPPRPLPPAMDRRGHARIRGQSERGRTPPRRPASHPARLAVGRARDCPRGMTEWGRAPRHLGGRRRGVRRRAICARRE